MQGVTPLNLRDIEGYGLSLFFILGVVLCLISIVWSGVQWVTGKKDKAKRARAKRKILWLIVGLVITFLITFILNIIYSFFAIKQMPATLP
jgi:Na+-driven multidrug efflux pump